jgi:tRNA(Ile2) C34 agmatinyltransferase TiaS
MSFDGSRQTRGRGEAFGIRHTIGRLFRSLLQRLAAWRFTQRSGSSPAEVVIGTLKRPRLAITIRATVVRAEPAPPPLPVFLERLVAHPLSPYCPRCSLPLEPWHGDVGVAGRPIGYECRPCGTHIRWPPADVLKQMQREVRRHYAHYWAQYQEALRPHVRGASRGPPH